MVCLVHENDYVNSKEASKLPTLSAIYNMLYSGSKVIPERENSKNTWDYFFHDKIIMQI